jgi:glycosyltransferase involved in cell wall biosynthesis/CDP-glycerol glycerophosphotransferase (TagB/SpsB family)
VKAFTFARANGAKLLRLPAYVVMGLIAVVFPRDRWLWVFGRQTGVGDGSLRLLRTAQQRYPHMRAVWIAQNADQYAEAMQLGLEVVRKTSWRARWLTLRAGVGVVTHGYGDLCRACVPGTYLVQLWHGAPLKRIHLDAPNALEVGGHSMLSRFMASIVGMMFRASARSIRCLPSPSLIVSERFRTAWGWHDLDRIRLTGDPRCDVLLDSDPLSRRAQARALLGKCLGDTNLPSQLVLLAPTWRDGNADPDLPDAHEMLRLNAVLEAVDAWLVVRSHPCGIPSATGEARCERIRFLPSSMLHDINQALNAFDVLVTDYSAIAIDYSLLARPIVFLAPDLESYERSRGLYESYATFTGGEWSTNWTGATDRIDAIFNDAVAKQAASKNVLRLRDRYHHYKDAGAANRVLDQIARDLGLPEPTKPRQPEAPIKVMHVAGCLGGVETYLRLLASYHDATRFHFAFVLPQPCALSEQVTADRIPVTIVPMQRALSPTHDLRAALALRRAVKAAAPDIVHLHSSKAGLLGRIACIGLKTRMVYTPHAYFYLGKRGLVRQVFLMAEKLLDRFARSATLGTSPSEHVRAITDVGCPPQRVSHVLNAVEVDVLQLHRIDAVQVRKDVLMVARVSDQKNLPMFLQVVRQLHGTTDAVFHLIGVGHYPDDMRRLEAMMVEAGVTPDMLRIADWMSREDLLRLMAKAAVVVLTSAYESFGYVLAEANCLGVPVVGTDVDGIRDVIEHGRNGYLVPLDDAGLMAGHVAHLLSHRDTWQRMSDAAIDVARERFDMREAMARMQTFYGRWAYGRR